MRELREYNPIATPILLSQIHANPFNLDNIFLINTLINFKHFVNTVQVTHNYEYYTIFKLKSTIPTNSSMQFIITEYRNYNSHLKTPISHFNNI